MHKIVPIAHVIATIAKLKSGKYRAQVRRKGQYASKPFQKSLMRFIDRSNERDRRPTQSELDRHISYFENLAKTEMPTARIVKFAVATGMSKIDNQKSCFSTRIHAYF